MVRRIKDDLIDTLVFRNKYEIAISDILILPSVLSESETESKQKIKRNEARFAYLLSDGYPIQKLEIPNLKFELPN